MISLGKAVEVFVKRAQEDMQVEYTDEQVLAGLQGKVYPSIGVDTNTSTPDPSRFKDKYFQPWFDKAYETGAIPAGTDSEGYAVIKGPWGAKLIADSSGVKVVGVADGNVVGEISRASRKAQKAAEGLDLPGGTVESWIYQGS